MKCPACGHQFTPEEVRGNARYEKMLRGWKAMDVSQVCRWPDCHKPAVDSNRDCASHAAYLAQQDAELDERIERECPD